MSIPHSDKVLIEARDASIRLEKLAIADLDRNIDGYLAPNWRTRQMVKDWGAYVDRGGQTTEDEYLNFRSAFSETKGASNKAFSAVLSTHMPKASYDLSQSMLKESGATGVSMVTGEEDDTSEGMQRIVNGAARHLETYGWWKSSALLPADLVQRFKAKIEGQMTKDHGDKVQAAYEGKDGAPMQIRLASNHVRTYDELYEFAGDPLLLAIVQQYMGVPPILNTPVSFLNSFVKPKNERALHDAAQLYHHDMHRLGFVKAFLYLTDVDENSGPHTLIQGTHRNRPDALWADGRHSDADIAMHGIARQEINITGKAGTVFLVDTSCLHKGAHPTKTSRLMAQAQYVNSLFGKPLPASDRRVEAAQKSRNEAVLATADLVRKAANRNGIRFAQNLI